MNKPIAGPLTHRGSGLLYDPDGGVAAVVTGSYMTETEMTARRLALSYNTLARLSLGQITELAHVLDKYRSFSISPEYTYGYVFDQEVS